MDLYLRILISAQNQASAAIRSLAQSFGPVGVGLAAVGVAAMVAGVEAVKMAGNFQQATTALITSAGESAQNIEMVRAGILSLSVSTATSTQQLTAGMYMIESAGFHGAAGLAVLKAAAEGAKAENADLGAVANTVTSALNAYSLSSSSATAVTNSLVATVASGKMHMQDLATSLANVLPAASAAHVGLYDVEGAIATMTMQGDNAANAATHLRQMILALVSPSKAGASSLAAIGLSTQQVASEMKVSLPGALIMITDALKKKFPEGSSAYITALKNIAGGSKQMMAMLELTGSHLSTFGANVKTISGQVRAGGSSILGFAEVQGELNFKLAQVKNAFDALMITLGTKLLPVITPIVGGVAGLITAFTALISGASPLPPLLQDIGNTFTQVGGIVKSVFSLLSSDITGKLTGAFKQAQPVVSSLGNTIHQVLMRVQAALSSINPQGIVNGIKQIGQVFLNLSPGVNLFQALASHAQELGKWFQSSVVPAFNQAKPGFQELLKAGQSLLPVIQTIGNTVHSTFQTAFSALLPVFEKAIPLIIKIAGVISGGLGKAIQFLAPYLQQAVTALGQFAGEIAQRVAPILLNFVGTVENGLNAFLKIWNAVWPSLAPIFKAAWDIIVGVVKTAWALVSGVIKIGLDLLSGNWKKAWEDFKTMLAGVWDGIKTILKGAWDLIKAGATAAWTAIVNAIKKPIQGVAGWLGHTWDTIKNGVATKWNQVVTAIKGIVTGIGTWLKSTWQNIVNAVVNWFKWLYNHNYYFKNLVDAIKNIFTAVKNFLTSLWTTVSTWIVNKWNWLKTQATTVFNAVKTFLTGVWNTIKSDVQTAWNTITSWLSGAWKTIQTNVSNAWDAISKIFGSAWSKYISGPLASLLTSIKNWFSGLATSAIQWGKNVIQGFIDGINSMLGAVGNAASGIIKQVSQFLGFHSPAAMGEGQHIIEWGQNAVKAFAQGMQMAQPLLNAQISHLIIAPSPLAPVSLPAHGQTSNVNTNTNSTVSHGPVTVHNHFNVQQMTQTEMDRAISYMGDRLRAQFGNI